LLVPGKSISKVKWFFIQMVTNGTGIFEATRECIGFGLFFVGTNPIIRSLAFK